MCVQATFAQVWFAIKCMIQHPNVCWLSHGISILKKKRIQKKTKTASYVLFESTKCEFK